MSEEKIKKLESIAINLVSKFIFEEVVDIDDEYGIISITGIKISNDLSYLDIYVSSFKSPNTLAKMLSKHGYAIQKKLNKALEIRKIPKVRFRYDSSGETGERVNTTINNLNIK